MQLVITLERADDRQNRYFTSVGRERRRCEAHGSAFGEMHTLQATRDIRQVSLWLGHASLQSTEIYLRADPTEKLEALGVMKSPMLKRGRFRAPDKVLSMLNDVRRANIMRSNLIAPP